MGVASGFGRSTFVGPGADIGRATIVIDGDSSPFLAKLAGLKGDALLGLSGIGKEAIKIAKGVTVAATLATAAAVGGVIKTFASFEDAFAGVAKTVDATDAELAKIQQGLRDLAKQIPVNFEQLSDLARLAGQFGVATGDIVEFTRVMALLSVTIDDLDIEAAASALARLATILQIPNEQFMNLGSTLTDLGNKFASAEGDILNLSTRIAGASKLIGISAAQVLGIGNAFAVVVGPQGLEAAGTAIQKVLLKMNTAIIENGETLELFAKTAGVSVEEFKRLFEQDAAEAFTKFVEGLGRQGKEAEITLRALELGDARLIRSFLQMAGAGDLLRRSIGEANTAFRENTALTKEAEKRFETLISQLAVFKNRVRDLGFELSTILKPALVEALKRLSDGLQGLQDVLGPGFSLLAGVLPEITTGMVDLFKGVANLVTAFLRLFTAVSEDGIPAIGQLGLGLGKLLNQLSVQLAPAFTTLGTVLSKLVDLASTIFGGLSDEINTAFGAIGSGISDVLGDVLDAFTESLPQIAPLVVEMSRAFADFLSTSGPEFASFLVSIVERSAKAATGLLDIFSVLGGPVLKVLGELFNQIGIVVLELSRIIQRDAGQAFTNLADAIVRLLQVAGPALLGFLTKAIDAFIKTEPAITLVIDTLAALVPVIANALTPILDVLPGLLGTLAEVLAKVAPGFGEFATKLLQAFSTIAGPLAEVLKIVGDALIEILPLVNLFADAFFKVIGAIAPDVFKTLAGVLKTLIPALTSILPALQAFLEIVLENFGPIADILIPALAEAIIILLDVVGKLLPVFTDLLIQLQPVLPEIILLIAAFAALAQIIGPFIPLITAIATTFAAISAGPGLAVIGLIAGAIALLATQAEFLLPPLFEIGKLIGEFLFDAFKAFQPVLAALGPVIARVLRLFSALLSEAILPAMLRIIIALVPVIVDVVNAFAELFPLIEALLPLFFTLISFVADVAETLFPLLSVVIRDLVVPILRIFTRIMVFVIERVLPLLKFGLEGIVAGLDLFVKVLSVVIRYLGIGLVGAIQLGIHFLASMINGIYIIIRALNEIPIVGRAIPDSLVNGLGDASKALSDFANSLDDVVSEIDVFEFQDAGESVGKGVATGLDDSQKGVSTSLSDMLANLDLPDTAPITQPYANLGVGVGSNLASGISSQTGTVAAAGQSLIDSLKNNPNLLAQNLYAFFHGLGSQTAAGFAQGINASINLVTNAVIQTFVNPFAPFVQFIDPGSPSRTFRDFGLSIVDGLLEGMGRRRSELQEFIRHLQEMVAGIIPGAQMGASGLLATLPNLSIQGGGVQPAPIQTGNFFPDLPGIGTAQSAVGKVVNVGPITVNQVKEDPVATAFKLSNLIAEGVL